MTLEERFEWLKNNKPNGYKNQLGLTWEQYVETEIKGDMYRFTFNHPFYGGYSGLTDDEQRHILLDSLNVPK